MYENWFIAVFQVISHLLGISNINWHKSIYYCFSGHFKFVLDFQYVLTQIDLLLFSSHFKFIKDFK